MLEPIKPGIFKLFVGENSKMRCKTACPLMGCGSGSMCLCVCLCMFLYLCVCLCLFVFLHLCSIWASTTRLQGALMGSGRGRLAKPMLSNLINPHFPSWIVLAYLFWGQQVKLSLGICSNHESFCDTLHCSDGVREEATGETNVIKHHKSLFLIMKNFKHEWFGISILGPTSDISF